jgi:hypothetical protein
MNDTIATKDLISATCASARGFSDESGAHGHFHFKCYDKDGNLKWEDDMENTVMTLGKDALLTNALKGSAYTANVYVGLISANGYVSIPVAGDTLLSHATWAEAGSATVANGANSPSYTNRATMTFGTASAGSLATSVTSDITIGTYAGTAKGAMIVFNGATNVNGNTTGTLYAAGLFSGDKAVVTSDVIKVSYTATLTG